ncbi:hypothetical protein [Rossellomorea marisflavi]|uniref:hypothetical protein n=1 Tax=Rossellomorea marisflavi TaxID=189381 RepID=UPI003FA0B404
MKLVLYRNGTYEEQIALVNEETGEAYIIGDDYHDKASVKIEGYLLALKNEGIYTQEVEEVDIQPSHPMFKKLYFSEE